MFRTNTPSLRHSATAALCAILFSTTCLIAAAGPVRAAAAPAETPRMTLPMA